VSPAVAGPGRSAARGSSTVRWLGAGVRGDGRRCGRAVHNLGTSCDLAVGCRRRWTAGPETRSVCLVGRDGTARHTRSAATGAGAGPRGGGGGPIRGSGEARPARVGAPGDPPDRDRPVPPPPLRLVEVGRHRPSQRDGVTDGTPANDPPLVGARRRIPRSTSPDRPRGWPGLRSSGADAAVPSWPCPGAGPRHPDDEARTWREAGTRDAAGTSGRRRGLVPATPRVPDRDPRRASGTGSGSLSPARWPS
jgi:hypothetical protein